MAFTKPPGKRLSRRKFCSRFGCNAPVVPGQVLCLAHKAAQKQYDSRRSEKRKESGKCTRCNLPNDDIKYSCCTGCRHRSRYLTQLWGMKKPNKDEIYYLKRKPEKSQEELPSCGVCANAVSGQICQDCYKIVAGHESPCNGQYYCIPSEVQMTAALALLELAKPQDNPPSEPEQPRYNLRRQKESVDYCKY